MRRFSELVDGVAAAREEERRVRLLATYFAATPAADAAWAAFLLTGGRLPKAFAPARLRPWAIAASGLPAWLFEACYQAVGDLAETAALVLPETAGIAAADVPLHRWIEVRIPALRDLDEARRTAVVAAWWRQLPPVQVRVLGKLLTGGAGVRLAGAVLGRALAEVTGLAPELLAGRLAAFGQPSAEAWAGALAAPSTEVEEAAPATPGPVRIRAVLTYAETGFGGRGIVAYTFAVRGEDGELVTLTRAERGLDEGERRELDRWIRRHTRARFGPVQQVDAERVYELEIAGLETAKRRKSGLLASGVRILGRRRDASPAEADSLADLHALVR